jgi:hypothetical protein
MSTDDSSFEHLEKKLAKDILTKALKDLHGEIHQEIERNKATFSNEIKQTLNSFKKDLEQNVSLEIDQRISALLEKHFFDISAKVTSNFYENFSPVLERTKEDMQRLHTQGETTLHAWKEMMKPYAHIWNKPFFLMLLASVLVGTLTSVFSSYLLVRDDRKARLYCEKYNNFYIKKYLEAKEALDEKNSKSGKNNKIKNKVQNNTK